jgi:choline dehydrogenase-like flavoprotein
MSDTIGYGHYSGSYWNRHALKSLGGTSNVWTGWCATLRDFDFDNPAVGVSWPITRSDLLPFYRKAAAILDRDPSIVEFEKPVIPGFTYRPFSRNAPTRFAAKYLETLKSSTFLHVATGCSAVGFDADPSRRSVQAIRYFHHASGSTRRLTLGPNQSVVVAAGGLGNAQLLLQPGPDGQAAVGNESGHVGRYLMEHPHFSGAAEIVLDQNLSRLGPPAEFGDREHTLVADRALSIEHQLYGCSIECERMSTDHVLAQFLARELGRPFYHYYCYLRVEMLPSPSNYVFLTAERDRRGLLRPGARCVLDARDFINCEMTLRLLGERLIAQNKGRVRLHNDRIYKEVWGGGHIMGTTRMGQNPSTSVVDRDCRVHGYANFNVAGSSVFPSVGYSNPTLTIVALAQRLGERLARQS